MSRTAFAITTLNSTAGTALAGTPVGGTAIDQANGMSLTGYGNARAYKLFLLVNNTAASGKAVTIKAGAKPLDVPSGPSFRATLGDASYTVAASSSAILGPFESARFTQSDGSLWVDFGSGATGTVQAFLIPQGI